MLQHQPFVAKIGLRRAENGPSQVGVTNPQPNLGQLNRSVRVGRRAGRRAGASGGVSRAVLRGVLPDLGYKSQVNVVGANNISPLGCKEVWPMFAIC